MKKLAFFQCPVCSDEVHVVEYVPALNGEEVRVSTCVHCELSTPSWNAPPGPPAAHGEMYPISRWEKVDAITDHYHFYMARRDEWNANADDLLVMVDRLRYWLIRFLPVGEVGAGSGALASAITRLGYQYMGCEPGELCQVAREHFALTEEQLKQEVFSEYFSRLRMGGTTLGVVFVWHVLEHVARPDELMRLALASVLQPGGKVLVQVPWMIEKWMYPQHVHFFTEKTFQFWAEKYGAVVRLVEHDDVLGFDLFILETI